MIEKFDTLQQLLEKYPKIEIGNAEDLTNFIPVNNLIPICRVKKTKRPTWACQCKICKHCLSQYVEHVVFNSVNIICSGSVQYRPNAFNGKTF